jgi:hypothetical protein
MNSRLRIIVTGLIAQHHMLAGIALDYLSKTRSRRWPVVIVGEGVLPFLRREKLLRWVDKITEAIEEISANHRRHSSAAQDGAINCVGKGAHRIRWRGHDFSNIEHRPPVSSFYI